MEPIELLNKVITDLNACEFFRDFKYVKSKKSLIKKDALGSYRVYFRHWMTVKDDGAPHRGPFGDKAINIHPVIERRFDILHKWFEPIWHVPIKEQRDVATETLCRPQYNLGYGDYRFFVDESDYHIEFERLHNDLISHCDFFFKKYDTLERLYNEMELDNFEEINVGVRQIFIWIALSIIVKPNDYAYNKIKIKNYLDYLFRHNAPDIINYYNRFDEIFDYIEHYDFSKEKKKAGLI